MFKIITAIFLSLYAATPAMAAEKWVGDWLVHNNADTCFMSSEYETGTQVNLVAPANTDRITFMFSNKSWRSIVPKSQISLTIEFDDFGPWNMNTVGFNSDELGGGFAFQVTPQLDDNGDNFLAEFAIARSVYIARNGVRVAKLDLSDSKDATLALARCLGQIRSTEGFDPFNEDGTEPTPKDPFQSI